MIRFEDSIFCANINQNLGDTNGGRHSSIIGCTKYVICGIYVTMNLRTFLIYVFFVARHCSQKMKLFVESWDHVLSQLLVPILDPDLLVSCNLLHDQNMGSLFGSIFWTSKVTPKFHICISTRVSNTAKEMGKKGDNRKCNRQRILHKYMHQHRPTQRRSISLSPEYWYFFGLNFDP